MQLALKGKPINGSTTVLSTFFRFFFLLRSVHKKVSLQTFVMIYYKIGTDSPGQTYLSGKQCRSGAQNAASDLHCLPLYINNIQQFLDFNK